MEGLTVSNVASQVGLSADTVRYYERIGLLPSPSRTPSGYRLYDESATERLRFIKGAQRFGLRLDEIRELLDIRDRGMCPCGHTQDLLTKRIGEVDRELARLNALRSELTRMVEGWHGAGPGADGRQWHCSGDLIAAEALTRPEPPAHETETRR
jgi:DNA-binding transcriptional MerR regulator